MAKTFPLDWHKRRSGKGMSPKTELVLNILYAHNEPIHVMELIKMAEDLSIASMVSCHNGIAWLREHGYVKVASSTTDKRNKLVDITTKGKGYFV